MTLYEITGGLLQLLQLAEEEELDPEALEDTLEGIEGEFEDKAENYAKMIRTLESDAAGIKDEIDRLTRRRKTIENNIKRLKEHLEAAMIATGKTKFKTTLFSFGIQKNPAAVVIDNEEEIPERFFVPQDPKLDKIGVKDYLKENEAPWAHLEQTESLRIR
ncbi:MAG: siphovirus Gp157 family protein [Bacteroidales bacterium]|nr:siphovirus Gp157 family protein [Bacteroidales bacterium]